MNSYIKNEHRSDVAMGQPAITTYIHYPSLSPYLSPSRDPTPTLFTLAFSPSPPLSTPSTQRFDSYFPYLQSTLPPDILLHIYITRTIASSLFLFIPLLLSLSRSPSFSSSQYILIFPHKSPTSPQMILIQLSIIFFFKISHYGSVISFRCILYCVNTLYGV